MVIRGARRYNGGVSPAPRRRILVALVPMVLEGAFATLLRDGDAADVVQFHRATDEQLAAHYDAAIVTAGVLSELHPDLLITLPDTELGQGDVVVTAGAASWRVRLRTYDDVAELIDPLSGPRAGSATG